MTIRSFQPGDEAAQVSIYNEAAAELPKFKPATLDEVRRRCRSPEFDPGTRFYALDGDQPVAYGMFHANGRVSYPWCRKGHESWAAPLFGHLMQAARQRGLTRVFAAYRADWNAQLDFFAAHGFQKTRELVNFVLELIEMPTPAAKPPTPYSNLRPEDLPALVKLAPEALRTTSLEELERYFLHNPYFPPESLFVLRGRTDGLPEAVGLVIVNNNYANPRQLDASMPCFRLGAFGTEGMQTKRVNGLFSFLTRSQDANRLGLQLMGHAGFRLQEADVATFAAQVPSDAPALLRFYQSHFRRQGSFPVLERALD
jgi:hypothetical protein